MKLEEDCCLSSVEAGEFEISERHEYVFNHNGHSGVAYQEMQSEPSDLEIFPAGVEKC